MGEDLRRPDTEQQPKLGRQSRTTADNILRRSREGEDKEDKDGRQQGQMFEASWERIDSARNPDLYETNDGVTFLRGNQQRQEENTSVMQTLTEEELRNVEKAAEKMNDRED